MDRITQWIAAPSDAYRLWQETEAVGADRRPFSARSRMQHAAMFDRFLRYLRTKDVTVATFSAADVESFFADVDTRCAPGTTTRLRYGKMLDRLCRHLVEEGIRTRNPVTAMATFERWPEDEPVPLFLDVDADARLQEWVQPVAGDDDRASRNRAIVALFLGTGVTAAELRQTLCGSVVADCARPHVEVPKRGPRESRRVTTVSRCLFAQHWPTATVVTPHPFFLTRLQNSVPHGLLPEDPLRSCHYCRFSRCRRNHLHLDSPT
jgi:site-specific recombinase XerC